MINPHIGKRFIHTSVNDEGFDFGIFSPIVTGRFGYIFGVSQRKEGSLERYKMESCFA